MVCVRMGLLDDAIRDHLDLKRLRGADPVEVAREQKEALSPVLVEEDAVEEQDPLLTLEEFILEDGPITASEGGAPEGEPGPSARLRNITEPSTGSEETAELDMRTVLGE